MGQVSGEILISIRTYFEPILISSNSLVSKASMGYSYDTNCEMQQLYNLTELDIIRDKLGKLEVDKLGPEDRYGYTGFEEGNAAAVESSGTLCYTFLHYDKFEMQKRDASHYSFIRPDSYDRVFVLYDTVTFVSLKKGVDMKPIRCLSAQEAKYVHETSGYARGSIFYPRVTLETIV